MILNKYFVFLFLNYHIDSWYPTNQNLSIMNQEMLSIFRTDFGHLYISFNDRSNDQLIAHCIFKGVHLKLRMKYVFRFSLILYALVLRWQRDAAVQKYSTRVGVIFWSASIDRYSNCISYPSILNSQIFARILFQIDGKNKALNIFWMLYVAFL